MVTRDQIRDLARAIVGALAPDQIILFGSYAWGQPRADSDVDLFVVMPDSEAPLTRPELSPGFPCDLIMYRRREAARRYLEFDPLVRDAVDRGLVLYTRPGMNQTVRDWVTKAEHDLRTARLLLEVPDPLYDIVAYHAQQAVEKLLKALLMHQRTVPPRTHHLVALNRAIHEVAADWPLSDEGLDVLSESFFARYPGADPTADGARQALALAERVHGLVLDRMNRPQE